VLDSVVVMTKATSLPADLELPRQNSPQQIKGKTVILDSRYRNERLVLPTRAGSLPPGLLSSQTALDAHAFSMKMSPNIKPTVHQTLNPSASNSILNGMPYSLKPSEGRDRLPFAICKCAPPIVLGA
jgi:hypothetical protein